MQASTTPRNNAQKRAGDVTHGHMSAKAQKGTCCAAVPYTANTTPESSTPANTTLDSSTLASRKPASSIAANTTLESSTLASRRQQRRLPARRHHPTPGWLLEGRCWQLATTPPLQAGCWKAAADTSPPTHPAGQVRVTARQA
eukprot:353621-Chlamydomonas_euryale.AAC.3